MAGGTLFTIGLLAAAAAAAQAEPAPAPPVVDPQTELVRRELETVRAELERARADLARAGEQRAALTQCRERNARLVAIGNELIAAYDERYQRSRFLPFDYARRKFEGELQATGDRVYDNKVDAGPRAEPPAPVSPPPTNPTP